MAISRAQMAELQAANAQIDGLLARDLRQVWSNIPMDDRDRARDLLLEFMPMLVDQYGKISASLAAQFFEDVINEAPMVAPTIGRDAVEASTRWALGPMWDGNEELALSQLTSSMTRHVRQAGSDTVHGSAEGTRGVAWARVPSKAEPCNWCLIYASRGAVYKSETSAVVTKDGKKYHDDCYCQPVAVRSPADYPPGYDPDALYALYENARDNSANSSIDSIADEVFKRRAATTRPRAYYKGSDYN